MAKKDDWDYLGSTHHFKKKKKSSNIDFEAIFGFIIVFIIVIFAFAG